jgi:hypothetical protein
MEAVACGEITSRNLVDTIGYLGRVKQSWRAEQVNVNPKLKRDDVISLIGREAGV